MTRTNLSLVGDDIKVPLVIGGTARYTNLDYAASTPCLQVVKDAVDDLLPWYSSVHRGAGWKSQVTTEAYESARLSVAQFVGARPNDCVLFTRNTTDSINLLISMLPENTVVLNWASDHHAALLPPRRRKTITLPIPHSPSHALYQLDETLRREQVHLVVVTGASNVTGEIWPYLNITKLAHEHGARVLLDAAQLAPHQPINISASDVDYIAFSGHKMYAPFGAGALVGRCHWLEEGEPFLAGGGAVDFVRVGDVQWTVLPDRQEAGSPNVLGAVALATACDALRTKTRRLADEENLLLTIARENIARIPGARIYQMWSDEYPRIGIVPFTIDDIGYSKLAAVLSAEWGIATRHGCFCAHPLVTQLLGITPDEASQIAAGRRQRLSVQIPGMVRASFGLGTTVDDILYLVTALDCITQHGPTWTYQTSPDDTQCSPKFV